VSAHVHVVLSVLGPASAVGNGSIGWPDAVQAVAALATLAVAVAAWRVAAHADGTERSAFLADMRAQWEARADDWATVLLLYQEPGFYYSDAGRDERLRVAALARDVVSGSAHEEWPSPIATERAKVRRVTRFFAHAGDALLRGQWSLDEAYALFGPDVARHWEMLRWLSHKSPSAAPRATQDVWRSWLDQLVEFNYYDEQEVLYVFAYLMRAEQGRRGDTYPHFVVGLAQSLRAGELWRLEAMLERTSRNRGRHPASSLKAVLRGAARPSIDSGYLRDPNPLINPSDRALFRPRFRTKGWTLRRIERATRERERMDKEPPGLS
jgi:hypothetical protein